MLYRDEISSFHDGLPVRVEGATLNKFMFLWQTAMGHEYKERLQQHTSQTDAAKGFGGKYGVQKDSQDKSAVDYTYQTRLQQHDSQKGQATLAASGGRVENRYSRRPDQMATLRSLFGWKKKKFDCKILRLKFVLQFG